jgi:hypothetical protein
VAAAALPSVPTTIFVGTDVKNENTAISAKNANFSAKKFAVPSKIGQINSKTANVKKISNCCIFLAYYNNIFGGIGGIPALHGRDRQPRVKNF